MITNYQEFLVEKLILSINESRVVYSDKFVSMLKKIDSPISDELLNARNIDYDVVSNYFDVDTKDTISFISDKKAQEIEDSSEEWATVKDTNISMTDIRAKEEVQTELKNKGIENPDLDFKPEEGKAGKVVVKFVTGRFGHVICVLHFGGDKYFATHISNCEPKSAAWIKNRQPIRIGRGIRALLSSLGKKFTDEEIEKFVNQWKSEFDWINNAFRNFELVSGDMIAFWYRNRNYEKGSMGTGTLGQSCMAAKPDYFFEIYTQNTEVCSLLILKSEEVPNTICARALVWKLDSGDFFMDRVYFYRDSDRVLFHKYAQTKGWWYKAYNDSSAQARVIKPNGESAYPYMQVTIEKIDCYYPYVDTLKYLTIYKDSMKLSNDEDGADYLLESTGGDRLSIECSECGGDGEIECPECNGSGDISRDCNNCDGEGQVDCDECDGKGEIRDGDGETEECGDCDGRGKVRCDDCDGDGEYEDECEDCDGRGRRDCPECS